MDHPPKTRRPEMTTRILMAEVWFDNPALTSEQARECAEIETAWLIYETDQHIPGWTFADATFAGPPRDDVVAEIMNLIRMAHDHVTELLDGVE
jgi:hypothetical protein